MTEPPKKERNKRHKANRKKVRKDAKIGRIRREERGREQEKA